MERTPSRIFRNNRNREITSRQRHITSTRQHNDNLRCDGISTLFMLAGWSCACAGLLVTAVSVFATPDLVTWDRWQSSLLGLLLICSGIMAIVKGTLRIFFSVKLPNVTIITEVVTNSEERVPRNPSNVTLPPSYDTLNISNSPSIQSALNEAPPPDYEEAVFLITDEKLRAFMDHNGKTDDETKDIESKSVVPK